ncbi:MAG: hypothetical protein ACREVG_16520, partial [Burkholderiales bacterium]
SGEAWRDFHAINKQRVSFTDYGYSRYFSKYPLDAVIAGFTFNDIRLLETFFFADPRVFSVERFERATKHVSIPLWMLTNISNAGQILTLVTSPHFLALAALLVLFARYPPPRQVRWSVLMLVVAVIVAVMVGRPGTSRIFIPPLAGIVLFALASTPAGRTYGPRVGGAALAVAAAVAIALLVRNAEDRAEAGRARAALCALPPERLYVVWGDVTPVERVYTPLSPRATPCPLRMYGIGVYAFAPFALERLYAETESRDLIAALLNGKELDFLAPGGWIHGLEIYARQHYGAKLVRRRLGEYGQYSWYRVSTAPR